MLFTHLRNEVFVSVQGGEEVPASPRGLPVHTQMPAPHEKHHVVHGIGAREQSQVSREVLCSIGDCPAGEACHLRWRRRISASKRSTYHEDDTTIHVGRKGLQVNIQDPTTRPIG